MKQALSILVAAAIAIAAAGVSGCGQKGPLHLPGYPENAPWPQFAPPPKAEPPARKTPDVPGTSDESR